MQDAQILLRVFELFRRQDIAVFQTQIVFLVEEALALHAGHVENVKLRHHGFQIGRLLIGDVVLLDDLVFHIARQLQLLRRDKHKLDAGVAAERADERMDRASKLEVSAEADRQIVEAALFAVDCQKVWERLGRMVVSAVACVDDRNLRAHRSDKRRALLRVAHGNDVCVAADRAHRIRYALALCCGRAVSGREAECLTAQAQHGRFKAQSCTG